MSRYIDERNTQNSIQGFNAETEKIARTQRDHLSRLPTNGPNQMQTDLDMNSFRVYNLPAPQSPNEPLRQADIDFSVSGIEDAMDQAVEAVDTAGAEQVSRIVTEGQNQYNRLLVTGSSFEESFEELYNSTEELRDETFDIRDSTSDIRDEVHDLRDEAEGFKDDSEDFSLSAQQSANLLSDFISDWVYDQLRFPLDLGFVYNGIYQFMFNLGFVTQGTIPIPPDSDTQDFGYL